MDRDEIKNSRVEAIGKGGYGIVFEENKAIFIPYVIEGELISYKIEKKKSSVWFGKLLDIIESSEFRVTPICKHYGQCGGCNFQHIAYNHQLKLKRKILENNLKKIAKLKKTPNIKIFSSEKSNSYRTKVNFKVRDGKIGFFKRNSNILEEIENCIIAGKRANLLLKELKRKKIIKNTVNGELLILTNGNEVSSVLLRENKKFFITDKREIEFKLRGFKYLFTPFNFIQANLYNLELMIKLLEDEIGNGGDNASDIFSGAGFFTIPLGKKFNKVFSYELDSENLKIQRKNLSLNNIKNVKIISGNIFSKGKLLESEFIVVDPPRGGLMKKTIEKIVSISPLKIIYFSCDSATFSRDIYYFKERGYLMKKLFLIDNFPHSDHFEIFSVLQKN